MKKIVFLALALFLILGQVAFAFEYQYPGPGDKFGQGKFPDEPHKTFRWVRYIPRVEGDNIIFLSRDSIVIWDTNSDDGVTVTTTTTSMDIRVAGIAVVSILSNEKGTAGNSATQDIGKRNWGWIQTYGLCLADFASSAIIAEGRAFGTSTEDGKVGGWPQWGATLTGQTYGDAGFVMEATRSATVNNTDIKVFLRGLD